MQNSSFKNTAVIIPVYNSEKHLKKLITEISEYIPKNQIIAVDDGSIDNSQNICRKEDVEIISYKENKGKGFALQTGLKSATEKGFSFAICMDSDQQHDPKHIPEFIAKQNASNASLILGFRDMSLKNMPFMRICSNRLTSFIVSFTAGKWIIDSQCGFRMYKLNDLNGLEFKTSRYQFETEILLKLAKRNLKFAQTPIDTIYGDEKSHIRHFRDIINFVKVIIKTWLNISV